MSNTCQYCGQPVAYRESSAHLYGGRDYGPIWECPPCASWVGCHPDGRPKGTVANAGLRVLRVRVKQYFNPLWMDVHLAYPGIPIRVGHVRQIMRTRAYEWLADQMKLPRDECHIAMFNDARCKWAVQIIEDMKPNAATIRQWAKAREPA